MKDLIAVRSRFRLIGEGREPTLERFAADVRAGLTATPKTLPCAWIYDARGSQLFEEICRTPEYYPTRAEHEILRARAAAIAGALPAGAAIVELGSGSALKTRALIEELLARDGALRYVPVDISRAMLEQSSLALLRDYPALEVVGIAAEYSKGLRVVRRAIDGPKLVLWLGSNVGNLDRDDAELFLADLRGGLGDDDRFLMGVDLRKDPRVLERAYDDAAGVTALFDKNLLVRINRELQGEFDVSKFAHRAPWNAEKGRMEMHLESLCDQTVRIGALDLAVAFAAGETIHTESSHKYALEEIDALAQAAGFEVEARWLDRRERFSLQLLRPAA